MRSLIRSASLTLFFLALASWPASAITYDPSADFSLASNPNGVWSYGESTTLTGPPTLFTRTGGFGAGGVFWTNAIGLPLVEYNNTDAPISHGTILVPPRSLNLYPGPNGEYSHVLFTVPSDGVYSLASGFSGIDLGGTTTDVHILLNGTSLFDSAITQYGPDTPKVYSDNLPLQAGDRLDFAVGFGSDRFNGNDATMLRATITTGSAIPEPCSLSLLALSLPVLVIARRGHKRF